MSTNTNKVNSQLCHFNINNNQQLLDKILSFCDKKKKTKKLINIVVLYNRLQQAVLNHSTYVLVYTNSYLQSFIFLLKQVGFINNFFLVPPIIFKSFLRNGFKPFLHNNLILIYLQSDNWQLIKKKQIFFISKPHRQIFITYKNLIKLTRLKQQTSIIFFINTPFGLITHFIALQKQIGGNLVCVVK